MIRISVSDEIRTRCPQFVGAAVLADVVNSEHNEALWEEINAFLDDYRQRYTADSIKAMPAIEATREAYRRCGKDPSRYRPSGEALIRRTLKGHELYRVSTLVDLINLASIAYGYSIGGFDADKIAMHNSPSPIHKGKDYCSKSTFPSGKDYCSKSTFPSGEGLGKRLLVEDWGEAIVLGIGREGEPYEGIGRGMLNIAGLPVYRDAIGGIGTPTSDHERTKLTLETTRLLAIVNGYDGNRQGVNDCAHFIQNLLRKYGCSKGGEIIEF